MDKTTKKGHGEGIGNHVCHSLKDEAFGYLNDHYHHPKANLRTIDCRIGFNLYWYIHWSS